MRGPDNGHQGTLSDEVSEASPRWLLILGAILLVAMMLAGAFAVGVYLGERNLL